MNLYQPTITGSLSVSGSVNISGSISIAGGGTISGTASIATTALTASSADNFLTRGTLTAQTLVVQTITSSVDFVTGSTRFGSLLSNTHVFSGSVTMNPNGLFVSSSGFVGLNKAVPQRQYTQVANANGIVFAIQNAGASNEGYIVGFDATGSTYVQLSNSANSPGVYLNSSGSSYFIGGNVGIGATNPTNRLEVIGVSGSTDIITPLYVRGWNATTNIGGTNTSYGGIHLSNNLDTTVVLRVLGNGHAQLSTDASGRFLSFGTDNFVERVRIASGGNIGVNETFPSSMLHFSKQTTWGTTDNRIININNSGTGGNINVAHNMGSITWYSGNSTPTAEIAAYRNTPASGNNIELRFYTATAGTPIESMRISSGGVITKQYQPLAMGAINGDQAVSSQTFTSIAFNTSFGFNQANVGSCWNNGTSTFTAPATGTYLINAGLYTSNVGQIAAFVNGNRNISMVSTTSTFPTTWHGTIMIKLSSGDALTLRGYGDNSGTVYQNTYHTWFGIYFLG